MAAPTGKGVYTLGPQRYPDGDPAGYAKQLGCSFVALLNGYGVETHAQRALDLGLRVYLYGTPEVWHPDNWADTFSLQLERAAGLGLAGIIADIEDAPVWRGQQDEVVAVAEALAYAAKFLSIGFTSFPTWPYFDLIAQIAAPAGVWGSPQLYGVLDPASPAQLAARGDRWKSVFKAPRYVPSLAAWDRNPVEQERYMRAFDDQFGALFWLSGNTPRVGGPLFNTLKAWQPRGRRPLDTRELFSTVIRNAMRPTPRFFT